MGFPLPTASRAHHGAPRPAPHRGRGLATSVPRSLALRAPQARTRLRRNHLREGRDGFCLQLPTRDPVGVPSRPRAASSRRRFPAGFWRRSYPGRRGRVRQRERVGAREETRWAPAGWWTEQGSLAPPCVLCPRSGEGLPARKPGTRAFTARGGDLSGLAPRLLGTEEQATPPQRMESTVSEGEEGPWGGGIRLWSPEGSRRQSRGWDPLVQQATSAERSVCQKAPHGTLVQTSGVSAQTGGGLDSCILLSSLNPFTWTQVPEQVDIQSWSCLGFLSLPTVGEVSGSGRAGETTEALPCPKPSGEEPQDA